MSRSLKKAPYVEKKLFDRIVAMNEKNEKRCSRPGPVPPQYSLNS